MYLRPTVTHFKWYHPRHNPMLYCFRAAALDLEDLLTSSSVSVPLICKMGLIETTSLEFCERKSCNKLVSELPLGSYL